MIIYKDVVLKYLGFVIKEGVILDKYSSFNFRCPFCGDSAISEKKQRGNLKMTEDGGAFYKCFNCNKTLSVWNFFKEIDTSVYRDFLNEIKELNGMMVIKKTKEKTDVEILKDSMSIYEKKKEFDKNNFISFINERKIKNSKKCIEYIKRRGIDINKVSENLYYIENIHDFIKKFFNKDMKISSDGILIPAFSINGDMVGFQIRIFGHKKMRYLGMKLGSDENMYFNIPNIDFNKDIFINEGYFDGCFIDNCISVPGITNITTLIKKLKDKTEKNIYVVLDNEKHNKELINILEECIKLKTYIFIWENVPDKDINDYALRTGIKNFTEIIKRRSYKGLKAKNELVIWKKRK